MKITMRDVIIDKEVILIPQKNTLLDLILTTHKACRQQKLPISQYPEYFYIKLDGYGYRHRLTFQQYQLACELTKFGETTIHTAEKYDDNMLNGGASATNNLSLRTLHQKMPHIIEITLMREAESVVHPKDPTCTKLAHAVPKTLKMLEILKKYNSEEKDLKYQLMSNEKIIYFETIIAQNSIQSFLKEFYSRHSYCGDLTTFNQSYQLEEETDLEFDIPVSDHYMVNPTLKEYKGELPKFLVDLKEIFIKIKKNEITLNKNYRLKAFEICFNELVQELKDSQQINQNILCFIKINFDELIRENGSLLENLLSRKEFRNYLISYNKNWVNLLIQDNLVNSIKILQKHANLIITTDHLSNAIKTHAINSLSYLLTEIKLSPPEKLSLGEQAVESGNLSAINILYPDQSLFYFSKILKEIKKYSTDILSEKAVTLACMKKDEIFLLISNAYRFSNIESVEKICDELIDYLNKHYSNEKFKFITEKFKTEFHRARQEQKKWRNQIGWYYTFQDNVGIIRYGPAGSADIFDIEKEIEFGRKNFDLVTQLCDQKFSKLTDAISDLKLPVCQPPEKFYSMSHLMHIISQARRKTAEERGQKNPEMFVTKRVGPCPGTRCSNQYRYMNSLIQAMTTCNNNAFLRIYGDGYELLYKGEVLGGATLWRDGSWKWRHGASTTDILEKFWPDVERLHKKLFDLGKKQVAENLPAFYQDVAEVLWLLGNFQMMLWGTGRWVEQWFAMVQYFHGLEIPRVKIGQLDCYGITFSLPIYKRILLYLFDIRSLDPMVLAAMKKQYAQDPETRALVKAFNLEVPKDFEVIMQDDLVLAEIQEPYPHEPAIGELVEELKLDVPEHSIVAAQKNYPQRSLCDKFLSLFSCYPKSHPTKAVEVPLLKINFDRSSP